MAKRADNEPPKSAGEVTTFVLGESDASGGTDGIPVVPLDAFDDLGPLGQGGVGEVRRVWDRSLARPMAMKTLRPEVTRGGYLIRFVEEARMTAQLQHPGVVPVHTIGRFPDGRHFFTMAEVRGKPMNEVIDALHRVSGDDWAVTDDGWSFRRVLAAFARACHAVGYAHSHGVAHRDLKPHNIMFGTHAEVQVIDWGLAKRVGDTSSLPELDSLPERQQTRVGVVAGTPAYMPPEQARGEVGAIDARSDTYSLGAVLYHILEGHPPFRGSADTVVQWVKKGPPAPVGSRTATGAPIPAELAELCARAMQRDPTARFADGSALAEALEGWLDGARRRDRAGELLGRAKVLAAEVESNRRSAALLWSKAEGLKRPLAPWADETEKLPVWRLEDEARELEERAEELQLEREQLLSAAQTECPELPDVHAVIASDLLAAHEKEESLGGDQARRLAFRLRQHTDALPDSHPVRWACETYLEGTGRLTLHSEPSGAEVLLHQVDRSQRRWHAALTRSLGRTPLDEQLPMGSYVLELRHPEASTVRYPVHLARQQHWTGAPAGEMVQPVLLPQDVDDGVYVPAGPFLSGGGSAEAVRSLPVAEVWVDGFVMQRFPVNNEEYLAFLNSLVDDGRAEEALACAPAERASKADASGAVVYGRNDAGHFVLVPDADGDLWDPDWPVLLVSVHGAWAYANWLAARTGLPWRLPSELEWEKAARGVDGRRYPWGNHFDPTWARTRDSSPRPRPATRAEFPVDESPYGARHMAGLVQEWCAEQYTDVTGPNVVDGRLVPPVSRAAADVEVALRTAVRGGSWYGGRRDAELTSRHYPTGAYRSPNIGFRLVRSV